MSAKRYREARQQLHELLSRDAYIAHKQAGDSLQDAADRLPHSLGVKLATYTSPSAIIQLLRLKHTIRTYERKRTAHNSCFVNRELKRRKRLFDNIGGYPLDGQQRRAVIADEDNSLVIAGAGSGKTLTIVGKVRYLLEAQHVSPQAILPISFTNKSAASLKERIGVPGVQPQTFHAFGLRVLRTVEKRQPEIWDDSHNDKLFRGFITRLAGQPDGRYLAALDEFLANYIHIPRTRSDFKNDKGTPPAANWQKLQAARKDEIDTFLGLVANFLVLLKSNGHSLADARQTNQQSGNDEFLKRRAARFISLFAPLLTLYERNLRQNKQIDFHDMVAKATRYIKDGSFQSPYRYVIVDEFQDLSVGRYRLLLALREQNPDIRFYCVGDDWQSIYRFAGSDMSLFRDFPRYFGHTAISRIETTYRFNQPLIGLSSEFILRNPDQTTKELRAPKGLEPTTYSIIESDTGDDDTQAVVEAIGQLLDNGLTPDKTAYVIGRYNFDLKRIQNRGQEFEIDVPSGSLRYRFPDGPFRGRTLAMQFITAHRSKGLEADYAILINCNKGKFGFPSGRTDDPLLSLLLSSADQYEFGEERRLFYVAMTRARRHVVLVADRYRKSPFIREIQEREARLEQAR